LKPEVAVELEPGTSWLYSDNAITQQRSSVDIMSLLLNLLQFI